MFRVLVRSFLNCFILSVLLTGSMIGLVGYSLYTIGRDGLRESRSVSEARGRELAAALAQMAGENEGAENYRVKMSSVMHEIVRRSREENAGFQVDEVFLLGVNGNVIAHSDVAKMAENADVDYSDKYFRDTLARPEEQPFAIDRIDEETFSHGVLYEQMDEGAPELARRLRSIFPERVTTRYRISRAVYSVDQRVPSGGIHMTVTNTTVNEYVNMLKSYTLKSLGLGMALVIFITTFMFFLISITFRKYARLNAVYAHTGTARNHQSSPESLTDGSAIPLTKFNEELSDLEPEDVDLELADPEETDINESPELIEVQSTPAATAHHTTEPRNEQIPVPPHRTTSETPEQQSTEEKVRSMPPYESPFSKRPVMDAIPLENISTRLARRPDHYN